MSYEVREGQGSLFVNDGKEGDQPDFRGNLRLAGVLYRMAGWRRTSKSGTRWLSLKAERDAREPPAPGAASPTPTPAPPAELNDDIPF